MWTLWGEFLFFKSNQGRIYWISKIVKITNFYLSSIFSDIDSAPPRTHVRFQSIRANRISSNDWVMWYGSRQGPIEPTTKSFVVGWIRLIESGHGYTNFEAIKRKHTNNIDDHSQQGKHLSPGRDELEKGFVRIRWPIKNQFGRIKICLLVHN